ncbi:MAG: hypothetical protein RL501_538 [Bacteroidota bacterium]|jgi:hypothetical protein
MLVLSGHFMVHGAKISDQGKKLINIRVILMRIT